MTVDSAYEICPKALKSTLEYAVEIESIGDVAMEAWITIDGVRSEVPFGYFDPLDPDALKVYWIYEEHLDPIKKRAVAVFSRPLRDNENLTIERKTPITQEIDFTGMDILNPNQLEYAFDKICFIEQEIEGHFCDCRGVVYPGDFDLPSVPALAPPGPGPEPENKSCEALDGYMAPSDVPIDWNFTYLDNPSPALPTFPLVGGVNTPGLAITFESHLRYRTPRMVADGVHSGYGSGTTPFIPAAWRDLAGEIKRVPDEFPTLTDFITPCVDVGVYIPSNSGYGSSLGFKETSAPNSSMVAIQGPSYAQKITAPQGYFYISSIQLLEQTHAITEVYDRAFINSPGDQPIITQTDLESTASHVVGIDMFSISDRTLIFQATASGLAPTTAQILSIPYNDGFETEFHVIGANIEYIGEIVEIEGPNQYQADLFRFTVSVKYYNQDSGLWETASNSVDLTTRGLIEYRVPPPVGVFYNVFKERFTSFYSVSFLLSSSPSAGNYHSLPVVRVDEVVLDPEELWDAWQENK